MRALETSACLEEWQGGPGAPCLAAADQDPHSGGIFTRTRSHSHHAMSDGGTASQSARDYAGGGCDAAVERAVGKPREDGVFARTRSHTETFDAMQIESLDEAVPQCEREKNGSQLSSVPRGGPLQASGEEIFRELVALGEHRQVSCEELDFALGEGPESTVVIGAGSGGVVYKAEYRGQNVAVKVALVPPEKDVGSGQGTQAQARSERGKGSSASCRHLPAPADKMLSASPIDAERQVKDMVQEIQAGLRLPPHPNLALFVGASLSPPNLFVVFELIDGLDIEALYRQKRSASGEAWRPPVAQVLRWGRQIYGVLDFLHTLTPPLIHRDVKPANVMLTSDLQTVKLVDFGLATGLSKKRARQGALVVSAALPFANSLPASGSSQAAGEDDSTQQRMTGKTGSFRYMAPEVMLEHEQYGAKVDVYSATMLLWYLLMGEPPFNGIEGDVVALMAAREGLRPNLREIKDDRLKAIMERGWHSDSETRASGEHNEPCASFLVSDAAHEYLNTMPVSGLYQCRCVVVFLGFRV